MALTRGPVGSERHDRVATGGGHALREPSHDAGLPHRKGTTVSAT
jgi:hypothetical protein